MLNKVEILAVIIVLLLAFYFVIWWGAKGRKNSASSYKISRYLFGVRILIIILALVAIILWSIGFVS